MNLLHLKYAVVIAETNSMTKAAERLYTAQPNLSRAMRELEGVLGITIFKRTSKGVYPTAQGEEFLGYARKVLEQADALEEMYKNKGQNKILFSISVPRASYISHAFSDFVKRLPDNSESEIFYKETNSMRTVTNITDAGYRLGILRYQLAYEKNFADMLSAKELHSQVIFDFCYRLIMSKAHPLSRKEKIFVADLEPFTEIAHADPFVPSMALSAVRKNEVMGNVKKHIYVFERGSQMELLSKNPETFMWVSPVPEEMLDRYGLIERKCEDNTREYRDVLIRKDSYSLTDTDKLFVEELEKSAKNFV